MSRLSANNLYYFSKKMKAALPGILNSPLTVIEAGSGFGKTTLITECFLKDLCQNIRSFIYTCLGEAPLHAWMEIGALFREVDESVGNCLMELPLPDKNSIPSVMRQMRRLKCEIPTILIMDNYQLTQFPEPVLLLDALSLHGCHDLHIITLTHPIQAVFMKGTPRIHHITSDVLTFKKEDIQAFFSLYHLSLEKDQLDYLADSTEGFATAVNLQLVHYIHNRNFISSSRISVLMEKTIWQYLSDAEKFFFTSISVLDHFTLEQIAHFGDTGHLSRRLQWLIQENPFIRYDFVQHHYTIHHLFLTFLKEIFEQWPEHMRCEVYKKAGNACAAYRDNTHAALFYCRSGELKLIEALSFSAHDRVDLVRLEKCLIPNALIEEPGHPILRRNPMLTLSLTLELFLQGEYNLHKQYYLLVKKILQQTSAFTTEQLEKLQGECALMESFLVFNDVTAMCALHQKSYELLKAPTQLYSLKDSWTFGSLSIVCMFWRECGRLEETLTQIEAGMPCYYLLSGENGRGAPLAMRAEMLLLSGDDRAADEVCYQAICEGERFKQDSIFLSTELTQARIAILRGQPQMYAESIKRIREKAYYGTEHQRLETAELCLACLNLFLETWEEIPSWLYDPGAIRRRTLSVTIPFIQVIYGKLMLNKFLSFQISGSEFEHCILELINESDYFHMLLPKVYFLIYLTVGRDASGARDTALISLKQAVQLASPDKVFLPFAEHYLQLEPLLPLLFLHDSRDGIKKLISLGRRYQHGRELIRSNVSASLSLSEREREIAWLLQQRMSAREIGEHLCISPNTVRNVMQKIYTKLGIHSKKELYGKNLTEDGSAL